MTPPSKSSRIASSKKVPHLPYRVQKPQPSWQSSVPSVPSRLKEMMLAYTDDSETQGTTSTLVEPSITPASDLEGMKNMTVEMDPASKALLKALMEELGYGQEGETGNGSNQRSLGASEVSSQELEA